MIWDLKLNEASAFLKLVDSRSQLSKFLFIQFLCTAKVEKNPAVHLIRPTESKCRWLFPCQKVKKGRGLWRILEWKGIAVCCAGDELDYVKKIKIIYQQYLSSLLLFFEILLLYLAKCFDLDALETKGMLVSLGTLFAHQQEAYWRMGMLLEL